MAMVTSETELDAFRAEVMFNVMLQGLPLTVANDAGDLPVVSCLDHEPVSALLDRVSAAGGHATVFSRGPVGRNGSYVVRRAAFISAECALMSSATDMTDDAPAANAPIGMLLDHLDLQPGGVVLPKALGPKAGMAERPTPVEFQVV